MQVLNYLKRTFILLFLFVFSTQLYSQKDSILANISYEGDFRFRIEQDWNSRKSDGTFRDDRTRLRYRLRAGMKYAGDWYDTGFRIRTGALNKQQDPQLTLGDGFEEFGTLPMGFEKVYFIGKWNTLEIGMGKFDFPFEKSNELFFSDNVYPEGVSFSKGFSTKSHIVDSLSIKGGHFIISALGRSFNTDAYLQGFQTYVSTWNNRIELFPSFYIFRNMPNIPDGGETFRLDYSIFHLGSRLNLMDNSRLKVEFDYYRNVEDYSEIEFISDSFKDQKSGFVVGLKYGLLQNVGDWKCSVTYASLQQYSAVDFMAQNDWARWDYSSFGSPDGRLTNLNGVEIVAGLRVDKKAVLILKYYLVEQQIAYGTARETGSRIRLDLDVKF